jgi:hypothetical protein
VQLFILLALVASTWAMVGLIWFIQIVHYPLMNQVGSDWFRQYERKHMALTTWVVLPIMLIEAGSNLLLIWFPGNLNLSQIGAGLAVLSIIWLSTFLLQVPIHSRLVKGFDGSAHRRLVATNWIRTIPWTVRGIWICWLLSIEIRSGGI